MSGRVQRASSKVLEKIRLNEALVLLWNSTARIDCEESPTNGIKITTKTFNNLRRA
jgi:hypothetical protein